MNWTLIATLVGILGGGGIIGLITRLVKISMDYQKLKSSTEDVEGMLQKEQVDLDAVQIELTQLKTKLAQNEKRDEEERKENNDKFDQLFDSRNKMNESIVELVTTLKMMNVNIDQQFASLNKKLDEIKQDKK